MVMTDEETTGAMAAGTTGMETEVGNRYQHPTDEPLTADRLVSFTYLRQRSFEFGSALNRSNRFVQLIINTSLK